MSAHYCNVFFKSRKFGRDQVQSVETRPTPNGKGNFIPNCFFCHPSVSTVSEDAGIETRTVSTSALVVRQSNHWARYHTQLDLIHDHRSRPFGRHYSFSLGPFQYPNLLYKEFPSNFLFVNFHSKAPHWWVV
jgi:hypothetical protein